MYDNINKEVLESAPIHKHITKKDSAIKTYRVYCPKLFKTFIMKESK